MAITLFRYHWGKSVCIVCQILTVVHSRAEQPDSLQTVNIPEVVVTENYQLYEVRSAAPLQQFTPQKIKQLNVIQLSDVVKHFSGVTVRDYGGIGGLKTVSVRSLGANHTGVSYDGILLSDVQSGQIDIGRFSLDNVDRLSLSNGQNDRIFQPARLFASAGLLDIRTLTPVFSDKHRFSGKVLLKGGSFGLLNPSVLLQGKIDRRWSASINGEWMRADGRYPYILSYGGKDAFKEKKKRTNTEVSTLRVESGLYGNFSDTHRLRLKAYYYLSSRGLPGATVFYKDYSAQHLWDRNFFMQAGYERKLSRKWNFRAAAKYNWSWQRYLNPTVWNIDGQEENIYRQQEYYLSASILFMASRRLSFSFSSDGILNGLNSNFQQHADPYRYSWLSVFAVRYVDEMVSVTGSLLATFIYEKVEIGDCAGNHRKLSPFISVSVKPFSFEEFRIRAFFKDIFRLPSFNDLYYTRIGNPDLKPESTRQLNLGLTWTKELASWLPVFTITMDGYWNQVTDKIIAIPTKNIFVWTIMNLGKVDIKGVDVTVGITLEPFTGIRINMGGSYTYQRALDVTDPANGIYYHQITYTPRISGSGRAGVQTPWVDVSYNLIFSGARYTLGQNFPDNRLSGYTDHSISVSRNLKFGKVQLSLNVEVLNLAGKNYEIIRYFPMQGRSFRTTVTLKY